MLTPDPDRRLTAAQALAEPFFEQFHEETDEPRGHPINDPLFNADNPSLAELRGEHSIGYLCLVSQNPFGFV